MMKHFLIALALVANVTALQAPSIASAQDIEVKGPLAGAPAVIGLRIYRELRLQVQLQAAVTLTDEFSQAMFFGGQLMFHPTDWLGFGIWGGFAPFSLDTSLTDQVTELGQQNDSNVLSLPDRTNFPNQIGQLKWIAAPQVTFIPLRGKLGIFESLFIDSDFYLFAGAAFVGLEERGATSVITLASCGAGGVTELTSLGAKKEQCSSTQTRESRVAIAPTFGVGLSLYMSDFAALTLEWRAFPFKWNTSGTDEVKNPLGAEQIDSEDRLSHFNHLFALGVAFFLPTEPSLSYMDE